MPGSRQVELPLGAWRLWNCEVLWLSSPLEPSLWHLLMLPAGQRQGEVSGSAYLIRIS